MTERPDIHEYYFGMCELSSTRSTCLSRKAGAVLVKDGVAIATGYNGPPRGAPHCMICSREGCKPGERLDLCKAKGLHAENNCLYACNRSGVSTVNAELYTLYSPCEACCNALVQAGIRRVYYRTVYPGFAGVDEYLRSLGIATVLFPKPSKVSSPISAARLYSV